MTFRQASGASTPVWFAGLVVIGAPVLAFPQRFPDALVWVVAAAVVAGVGIERHRAQLSTPLDLSLGALCAMALIAAAISPAPDVTVPKATGMVLGLAALYFVTSLFRTETAVWIGVFGYLAMLVPIIVLGFLATAWSLSTGALAALTSTLPRLISLPAAPQGINPNAEAAAVLCGLPLLTALLINRHLLPGLLARLLAGMWIASAVVLILTQSRAAWLGAAMTTVAMAAIFRSRRVLAGSAIAVAVATAVTLWAGHTSLDSRVVVWTRAYWAMQDFPLTGVGLGAFRRVVPVLYPLYDQKEALEVVHAHNQLAQVALDVGLPGLVSYLALLSGCGLLGWRVYRSGTARMQVVAVGLSGNMIALQVFGLTDAVPLGAKIGLFSWVGIGLLLAAHRAGQPLHTR